MNIDSSVLSYSEKLTFMLRKLYSESPWDILMSLFKKFLISDRVITFTDNGGKLKALKPDVTLSIIKNHSDGETKKLYYNENVYRVAKGTNAFKEIMQSGVECIGDIGIDQVRECVYLAADSLRCISSDYILNVSNLDILNAALERITDSRSLQNRLVKCVSEKNIHGILAICEQNGIEASAADPLIALLSITGSSEYACEKLMDICEELGCQEAFREFCGSFSELVLNDYRFHILVDFSVVSDRNYYNGTIFKGYINGVPDSVLSGGRYDKLMRRMKRKSKAIGFAVYLDTLERVEITPVAKAPEKMLNIALPKGRLGEKVYAMFEKAGYSCPSIREDNRKLIFENPAAVYVEHGAADIGVAGKDILLEYEPEIYELHDLDIGKCRMAVAAPKDFSDDSSHTLRVATKFSKIAADYYASKGRDIDIIHLNGSIEIAPILGLTDVIVDIVETGTTLRENNLEVKETIVPISARLIANRSSYQFKKGQIDTLVQEIKND